MPRFPTPFGLDNNWSHAQIQNGNLLVTHREHGLINFQPAGLQEDIIKELLKQGAAVDATTSDGQTALHIAVRAQHQQCALQLVAAGASVNVSTISPLCMHTRPCSAELQTTVVIKLLPYTSATQGCVFRFGVYL